MCFSVGSSNMQTNLYTRNKSHTSVYHNQLEKVFRSSQALHHRLSRDPTLWEQRLSLFLALKIYLTLRPGQTRMRVAES